LQWSECRNGFITIASFPVKSNETDYTVRMGNSSGVHIAK
jgi:hypothetical protein